MNKILIPIIVAVVMLTFSYAYVYAERSVVEVPFDYTGHGCTFDQERVIFTCQWEGSSETIPSDQSGVGIVPPEQIVEESKEAHEEAVEEKEEKELTPTERKIASLEEDIATGDISSADLILYDLLVSLKDTCELGIEHGRLIQNYNEFELPTADPRTQYKAINFKTNWQLGEIIKKIEECKAWDKYRVDVLGQRYLDIVKSGVDNQEHHRAFVQDKGTYPSDKLTAQSFIDSQKQAEDSICKASFYDAQFKKERGCDNAQVKTLDGVGLSYDNNPSMKAYREYMSGGTVDLESLKKQEVTKAQQSSLESFAQQHGIDIADLKNLVQNVDEYLWCSIFVFVI